MGVNVKGNVTISVGFDELVRALEQSALIDILKLRDINFIDILKTDDDKITYHNLFYDRNNLHSENVIVSKDAKVVRLIKAVQEIVNAWHDYVRVDGQEKSNEAKNGKQKYL